MIISVSRRTDVPAFFGDWFLKAVEKGETEVKNPYNPRQVKTVSLKPNDVTCFVFWTKNAIPFMPYLQIIHKLGYPFYFLYTITPYGTDLEKHVPEKTKIVENFREIVEIYGPGKAIWRYDPVIFTRKYDMDYHLRAFTRLSQMLKGYTSTCVFSFLEFYRKLHHRRWPDGFNPFLDTALKNKFVSQLNEIANSNKICLMTCCNTFENIPQSGCITPTFIQAASHDIINIPKDMHQRKNCRCIKSVDIGSYGTCRHGCLYCYAC